METEMTGMKPKDAIKLNEVPPVDQESYPPEDTLLEDGLYRYLFKPGEEHDDRRCRAMDRIWTIKGALGSKPVNHTQLVASDWVIVR